MPTEKLLRTAKRLRSVDCRILARLKKKVFTLMKQRNDSVITQWMKSSTKALSLSRRVLAETSFHGTLYFLIVIDITIQDLRFGQ